MKTLVSLAVFLAAASVFAAPNTVTCAYDHRAVDGGADRVTLTKDQDSGLYAVSIVNQRSVMSGGALATVTSETNAPKYRCVFSKKFVGLFHCEAAEVQKEIFSGSTLDSKIAIDELRGEAYAIDLETKSLTYTGTFGIDECKAE